MWMPHYGLIPAWGSRRASPDTEVRCCRGCYARFNYNEKNRSRISWLPSITLMQNAEVLWKLMYWHELS